jgi:dCTP deaminase
LPDIANTRSSAEPFLSYADNRALREQAWRMFVHRGDNGGATDNNATISQILQLRAERAKLLGFPTHAHWRLENTMAKTPERAMELMEAVWTPAVARVHEEVADMQKIADDEKAGIKIEPWDPGMVQPASVDLRLGNSFRVFHNHRIAAIDLAAPPSELTEHVGVADGESFVIHPGEFVLGSTLERVALPHDLVARLEGKSSLGRLGLLIHSTAGFVDAGFEGNLTLELSNVANLPITIYHGMPIGQISFTQMTTPVDRPYGTPGHRREQPARAIHRDRLGV